MLVHPILFDASMPVSGVLARLARYGIWLDPQQPDARDWIAKQASLLDLHFDQASALLVEPNHKRFGAAIRRQWYQNILWYPRPIAAVLRACTAAPRDSVLLDAMNLHEPDSRPTYALSRSGRYASDGIVLQDGLPVAVHLQQASGARAFERLASQMPVPASLEVSRSATDTFRAGAEPPYAPGAPEQKRAKTLSLWPRLDAPTYVQAGVGFDLTVGFGLTQQHGVAGGQVNLTATPGLEKISVAVELIADGLARPDGGWTRNMDVLLANPTSASVSFTLTGLDPTGPEGMHLTTLEIRYVMGGTVCGTASRPLVIGPRNAARVNTPADLGTSWLGQPPTASSVRLEPDADAADLTIELAKPDKNPTKGDYVCRLYSRHQLGTSTGPWDIHLGDDAKTFARTVIQGVRRSSKTLVNTFLRSVGSLVTEKLPPEVFDAIHEVAGLVKPDPPTILFVSAEPYVPWELALLDTPLDQSRPPFLGAQAVVGRWFRDPRATVALPAAGAARVEKPPANPPSEIPVKHMAALAGKYNPTSGLKSLPAADAEVRKLTDDFKAVELLASPQAVLQILEARLERGAEALGPAGAVHFAGHGQFDASEPDSSVLYLTDGTPLSSLLFRDARYGGDRQPIIFFNACMIGVGGEVLGDMGGFPGNCLRGGFGAVLGALWEVDDTVAREIAMDFWTRVLPPDGGRGEPVATVLRDLRAQYSSAQPIPTYMAYTYWGHPRLRLERLT